MLDVEPLRLPKELRITRLACLHLVAFSAHVASYDVHYILSVEGSRTALFHC